MHTAKTDYEMIIIGGGPAGCSAAITAHSLGVSVCIVEKRSIGGQVRDVAKITNLLGGPYSGLELANTIERQIADENIPVVRDEAVLAEIHDNMWQVSCKSGNVLRSRGVVAATGSRELSLREHPLIRYVEECHIDEYIYTVPFETLIQKNVLIIGSDRVLMTLIFSHGQSLNQARIRVLALPDKWYVIEPFKETIPFEIIRALEILSIRKPAADKVVVEYITDQDAFNSIQVDVVLTNLGKRPNSELFIHKVTHDTEGYLRAEESPGAVESCSCYVVGDVGHSAFQRIATAIGDGAYAALDYVYKRDNLYPHRRQV